MEPQISDSAAGDTRLWAGCGPDPAWAASRPAAAAAADAAGVLSGEQSNFWE